MVLSVCERLDVPLREQNRVLIAAGHAPAHPEHVLTDTPMQQVAAAIEGIIRAHEPLPALVVDRGWDLVAANETLYSLLGGVAPHLLEPPVNVILLSLDPEGLAPRIANLDQWREHLLRRLWREHELSLDEQLAQLLRDLGEDPGTPSVDLVPPPPDLLVPLRLRRGDDTLSLISTTTVFGTPREVTLSELAIETFHPADEHTRTLLGVGAPSPSS